MNAINLIFIVLLIFCSAFFSASEIAFTSVNALRLRRASESGDRVSSLAYRIYQSFDAAISAILIGNNLANIMATSLATVVFVALMGEAGAGVASIAMSVGILIFGEISPKIIAKQNSERFVRLTAYPLHAVMLVLTPIGKAVTFLVDKLAIALLPEREDVPSITKEEFSAILDVVEDEGVIDEDTTDLLQSALTFDDVSVQQVMTPRALMVALDIEDPLEQQLEEVLDSGYSRIPVYEDTIDNIIGFLHTNRFLEKMVDKAEIDLRSMLMEPLKLHKTMALSDALKLMRKKRIHIAIVIDEYEGTLGLITMEDMLEELVGEIWDEGDDVALDCDELGEGKYVCSGTMPIREFFELIDFEPQDFECEYVTLGGWAIEMLDAQPQEGRSFPYERLTVTVLKMDGMRVERLLIELAQEAGGETED